MPLGPPLPSSRSGRASVAVAPRRSSSFNPLGLTKIWLPTAVTDRDAFCVSFHDDRSIFGLAIRPPSVAWNPSFLSAMRARPSASLFSHFRWSEILSFSLLGLSHCYSATFGGLVLLMSLHNESWAFGVAILPALVTYGSWFLIVITARTTALPFDHLRWVMVFGFSLQWWLARRFRYSVIVGGFRFLVSLRNDGSTFGLTIQYIMKISKREIEQSRKTKHHP